MSDSESPAGAPRRGSVLNNDAAKELQKRLTARPEAEQLMNQGVLTDGGRIAAASKALEKRMNADAISRSIIARPDMAELIGAGIADSHLVAPSLAAAAKALERNLIANNLKEKLYTREEVAEANAGLFKAGDVAPRLRNAKVALEHAMNRDTIGHLLEQRPDPSQVAASGIVHSFPLASRLQAVQRQLAHNMTIDKLGHLLEKRSEFDDLQHQNIIKDNRVAPALQGAQRSLERNLAKANLYHALKHRPTVSDLVEKGLYVPHSEYFEEDEPTPSSSSHRNAQYAAYQQYQAAQQKQAASSAYAAQQSATTQSQYAAASVYQRRSKNFHLTRILLKFVATMAEAGELSLQQKGFLKDLIVDQDSTILAIAETFDADNDVNEFKDSLVRLASRR